MKASTYQIRLVNEHDKVIAQNTILRIIGDALKKHHLTKGYSELTIGEPTVIEFEPVR